MIKRGSVSESQYVGSFRMAESYWGSAQMRGGGVVGLLRSAFAKRLGALLMLVGFALIGFGIVSYLRYVEESEVLDALANEIIADQGAEPGDVLERLTHWVYGNKGFAKNQNKYVFSGLGPTPLQVLESGGDCADKSRLLSAMLFKVGIPNSLVMLYSPGFGRPTHTVVETRLPELRAVADPVFDIVYPEGHGGWLGVTDLRQENDLFLARIAELSTERGPESKVAGYDTHDESYQWPKTINWDKSSFTRAAGWTLGAFVDEPSMMRRPRVLEEPILFVAIAAFGVGVVLLAVSIVIVRPGRHRDSRAGTSAGVDDENLS